jgi:ribosomal protein S18 acetylase RimI-like enzyme
VTTTLRPLGSAEPGSGERSRSQAFAICANGRPIGSVRLAQQGGQGWILDLEVIPDRRRRGHGSIAVLAGEEVLRDWGCRRALLEVPAKAAAGLQLGEALGYLLDRQTMVKRLGWFRPRPRPQRGTLTRLLRLDEYQAWLAREITEYADALAEHGDLTRAEAQDRAAEAFAAVLPRELATPGVAVWVLEVAGETVGTVLVAFTARGAPRRGWVYLVQVDREHRGRGYGRALMLAAERESRARGLHELGLNVFASNPVAVGLYSSLGYRVDGWVLAKWL